MSKQYNYTLQTAQVTLHKKTNTSVSSQNEQGFQQMKSLWQENKDFSSKLSGADGRQRIVSSTIQTSSTGGCKHAELISYKVHKDQFKSLLVPAQKSYFGSKMQKNGKGLDHQKKGKSSAVSDSNTSKIFSDNHTVASDAELDSAYLNNESEESEDEMRSTDGEESDPHSPLVADSQYLNQSNDLRAALVNSKALVGDYVELKNCKRCGSMIFKDLSSAIKHKQEEFNADISPAQLLTKMFQDEARYKFDHYITMKDLTLRENKVARIYIEQRTTLVERIFLMGKKFNQRIKTLHIGIELMDRFFLDKRSQSNQDIQSMTARILSIYLTTCFLIASKYDEIDDQLVFINDVQRYYNRLGGQFVQQNMNPTYTDIVETERHLMEFYGWDLGFVMPYHFVEMFLANGVLFETEHNPSIVKDKVTAQRISKKCYDILDEMIKQKTCFKNQGFSGNQVASMIVYTARQEVLNLSRARHIWPKELQLISRQTDKQVKKLASIYKKGNTNHRIEPFAEDNIPNEQTKYQMSHIVDLTKQSSMTHVNLNYQTALVSPKASKINEKYSSEKRNTAEKVPVAQIIIPMAKKLQISSHKDQLSHTKVIQAYKVKDQSSSGVKNSLDATRNVSQLRNKKISLARSGCSKMGKMVASASTQKDSSANEIQRQIASAQKIEDANKSKLFAERRVSANNVISGGERNNNCSSLSLRVKAQNLSTTMTNKNLGQRSGQKTNTSANKTFNNHRLSSQKSQPSFKSGGATSNLRINSARQDILAQNAHQISSHSSHQMVPHTTKNICSYNSGQTHSYKNKLQSKYGINAQNKMIANGSLTASQQSGSGLHSSQSGTKSYQSSLSSTKVNGGNASNRLHPQNVWKRPSATNCSLSNNKRFENPYVYQKSKESHNLSVIQPASAFQSVNDVSGMSKLRQSKRDNSEPATLKGRDFRRPTISNARESLQALKESTNRMNSSIERTNISNEVQSIISKPRDIRDATSVKEVREIMNQVKSKYRNTSYKPQPAGPSHTQSSISYENLRL